MDLVLLIAGMILAIWRDTRKAGLVILTIAAVWIMLQIGVVLLVFHAMTAS